MVTKRTEVTVVTERNLVYNERTTITMSYQAVEMNAKSFCHWLQTGPLRRQGGDSETYSMVLSKIENRVVPFKRRDKKNQYIVDRDIAAVYWLTGRNFKQRAIGSLSWQGLGDIFAARRNLINGNRIKELLSQEGSDYRTVNRVLGDDLSPFLRNYLRDSG